MKNYSVFHMHRAGGNTLDRNAKMGDLWEDIFKEVANIGSGHAATALSAMLDRSIEQSVPSVKLVPLADIPHMLGGAEKVVAAGLLSISGDFSGYIMLILELEQAEEIISKVCGKPNRKKNKAGQSKLSMMDKSVFCEIVNILGGSYITAISEFTKLKAIISVPYLCVDMAGAVMSIAVAEIGKTGDFAVMFQSELLYKTERIIGDLFLLPDENFCGTVMGALGFTE